MWGEPDSASFQSAVDGPEDRLSSQGQPRFTEKLWKHSRLTLQRKLVPTVHIPKVFWRQSQNVGTDQIWETRGTAGRHCTGWGKGWRNLGRRMGCDNRKELTSWPVMGLHSFIQTNEFIHSMNSFIQTINKHTGFCLLGPGMLCCAVLDISHV